MSRKRILITLAKGGTGERTVPLADLVVPTVEALRSNREACPCRLLCLLARDALLLYHAGQTRPSEAWADPWVVPDLWHLYVRLKQEEAPHAEAVLEVWHLAHDLVRHLREALIESGR